MPDGGVNPLSGLQNSAILVGPISASAIGLTGESQQVSNLHV